MVQRWVAVVVVLVGLSCGGGDDGATIDAAKPIDTAPPIDSHVDDAAVIDGANVDAPLIDAMFDAAMPDAGVDAAMVDAAIDALMVDAGIDAVVPDAAPDATIDAPMPDAAVMIDAAVMVDAADQTIPDGTYDWVTWSCTNGTTTVDIKTFAMGIGITDVRDMFMGSTGSVASYTSATCARTSALTSVTYPSAGHVTYVNSSTATCSAGCTAGMCTPTTTQAVLTSTFAFTVTGANLSASRVLVAADVNGTLQGFAGCMAGWTETATYVKL